MFNFNRLYYFYVTAKLGGVMKGSKFLRISQPSLSIQLKNLEKEISLRLFEKKGRRMVLTPDGERAYAYCQKIFEASELFYQNLRNSQGSQGIKSRIGVTPDIERPFIADILSDVFKKKPAGQKYFIKMISDPHQTLMDKLKLGELDMVISSMPAYASGLRVAAVLSMEVVGVASPKLLGRTGGKKELTAVLRSKEIGLVLPTDRMQFRIETDMFLKNLRLENEVIFESDILSVIVRGVTEGIGVSFLPKLYIQKELRNKALVELHSSKKLWRHSIYLIANHSSTDGPITKEVVDTLLARAQEGKRVPRI